MSTITESGNNLIAMQSYLLEEKAKIHDQIVDEGRLYAERHEILRQDFKIRVAFLEARMLAIDSLIGSEPEPMRMAAE